MRHTSLGSANDGRLHEAKREQPTFDLSDGISDWCDDRHAGGPDYLSGGGGGKLIGRRD